MDECLQMSEPIFRKQALANQNDRLRGEVIISQPLSWRVLTLLLALCTGAAVFYLLGNDYTRREQVSGFLVPTKGVVAVFAPQSGLLRELYAADGDVVEQGQDLFTVQTDQKTAGGNYLGHEILQQLKDQQTRLLSTIQIEERSLSVLLEKQDIAARSIEQELSSLDARIATQTALQGIEQASYARARELRATGSLSQADLDNAQKSYLSSQQQLADLQASRDRKQFEKEENINLRSSYLLNSRKEIAELENRVSEMDRQLILAEGNRTGTVPAPVAGRITSLLPTLGQQLDASKPVLMIIPEDSQLEAHLYVPTRAIGFVQANQPVRLRYDAFPYQRFGLFAGHITQVTNAVLGQRDLPEALLIKEPVYRITAAVAEQTITAYGEEVLLKPGMLLSADIELDSRSLMEWLLEPIYSLRGKL
jgi:membrane fusion protein